MRYLYQIHPGLFQTYDGAFNAIAMLRGILGEKTRAEKMKDFQKAKKLDKQIRYWIRQLKLRRASARAYRQIVS